MNFPEANIYNLLAATDEIKQGFKNDVVRAKGVLKAWIFIL